MLDVVLTDVGDDQSLHKNLSTFSAHVKNLAEVLQETGRGALVLLDELAGGTDPREGEALAAGVLDSLCARGGAVAATTHYEGLKALALVDDRFVNASVGVDLATMTPTFELAMGVPGSSSALAVARRYGLPATVIERAERFLSREDQSFEAVVQKLHDERAALSLARAAAEERESEARGARERADAELETAKSRAKKMLAEEAAELMDRLRRAREDLRDARARLRSRKVDAEGLRDAERAIERVSGEVAIGGPLAKLVDGGAGAEEVQRDPVRLPDLRKGSRVWVPRLRAEADVVEVMCDGGVRVAAGPLKLTVSAAELRSAAPPTPAPRPLRPVSGPSSGKEAGRERPAIAGESPPSRLTTTRVICGDSGSTTGWAWPRASSIAPSAVGSRSCFSSTGTGRGPCGTPSARSWRARPTWRASGAASPIRGETASLSSGWPNGQAGRPARARRSARSALPRSALSTVGADYG